MNNLDQKIEQALRDASGPVNITDEATILEDLAATSQGQYRVILILAWVKAAAQAVLMVYCAYQFFLQDSVMAMLAYASVTIICVISLTTIYVIFYVCLNRNVTIREIKRLELQIALLNNKLEAQQGSRR